jgi:hypothetical protein
MNPLDEKKPTLSKTENKAESNAGNKNQGNPNNMVSEFNTRNNTTTRNVFDVIEAVTASYVLGYN